MADKLVIGLDGKSVIEPMTAAEITQQQTAYVAQSAIDKAVILARFQNLLDIATGRLMQEAFLASQTGDTTTVNACKAARMALIAIPADLTVTGATDGPSTKAAISVLYYTAVGTFKTAAPSAAADFVSMGLTL